MKKEIDLEKINKPKFNLHSVVLSNFIKTWDVWCSVWGIIGLIYWLNKLINYYV